MLEVSRQGRIDWLNKDLLLEIQKKWEVYAQWKQGQVMWEDYKNAAHHCGEKIPVLSTLFHHKSKKWPHANYHDEN